MIRSGRWPCALLSSMLLTELLLALLYWAGSLSTYPEFSAFTDLNGEGNLPAWFSSSQILLIAVGAWLLVFLNETKGPPSRPLLALLAAGATLWSMDEAAQLHERITHSLGARYIDWLPEFLISHKIIALMLVAVTLVALRMGLKEAVMLWRTSRRICLAAITGFCVCFLGGAVFETLGYKLIPLDSALLWRVEVTFEEFFEMSGASLILYAVSLLVESRIKEMSERRATPAVMIDVNERLAA